MTQILGTLGSTNGTGVVRIEDRYDTAINDLWSAITEPERLARWYGRVEGDLKPGGTITIFVDNSEWTGTSRIDVCEPPHRLRITSRQSDESWADGKTPYEEIVDATLTADGEQTLLVVEVHGLPLAKVAYYGAGWQQNIETLTAYLDGARRPGEERFEELVPYYLEQATKLG
jgi:uncharacterized protein YndB with AHSA1/START domain